MQKKGNDITPEEEEKIVKMLSMLRVEPAPEADFESRFLADFKNRVASDSVTRPARVLLWEHVRQFLDNVGGVRRWAMVSTSLAVVAFVAVALMNVQSDGVPKAVASVNTPVVEQVAPRPEVQVFVVNKVNRAKVAADTLVPPCPEQPAALKEEEQDGESTPIMTAAE